MHGLAQHASCGVTGRRDIRRHQSLRIATAALRDSSKVRVRVWHASKQGTDFQFCGALDASRPCEYEVRQNKLEKRTSNRYRSRAGEYGNDKRER